MVTGTNRQFGTATLEARTQGTNHLTEDRPNKMRVIAVTLCVVASAATTSAFVPMGPPLKLGARTRSMAAMHAEAGAKAWLESNQSPFWSPPDEIYGVTSAGVVATGAAPAAGAAGAPAATSGGWLAPGTPVLTLAAADEMSRVALEQAAVHASAPVSVCVLDATGRTLVVKTVRQGGRNYLARLHWLQDLPTINYEH